MTDSDKTTSEKVRDAAQSVLKDIENEITSEAPTVESHLKAFGEWTKEEIETAFLWLKSKL